MKPVLKPSAPSIAADQPVEIVGHPAAETDRGDMHEVFVFRQFADDRTRENRQVARRSDLTVGRQAVRIDVVGLRHAEPLRVLVHHPGKSVDRSADAFGEHDGHVVRRLHHHHGERVLDGDLRARLEAHLRRRLRGGHRRHRQRLFERQTAFLDRLQRHKSRHDLGDGGRIPRHRRIVGLQHAPLSASMTSQASAFATPDVATTTAAAAAIDFSGALPSSERKNCTIRFRSFETRLAGGGLECDARTFKRVRRRRLRHRNLYRLAV